MYVPKHFAVTDPSALLAFIRSHPFGLLISVIDGKPLVTHVPFVILDTEKVRLGLHVARANPHWTSLNGSQVLAVFAGAHGFVSASWYAPPSENVPTWNYSAVHCAGTATIASDLQTQRILETMVREFEGEDRWSITSANSEYVDQMKRGIVGIEISVTSIVGKFKYSQNRDETDLHSVLEHLDESAPELSRDMREFYDCPVNV